MSNKERKHDDCFMRETCLRNDTCPMVLSYNLLTGKRKILILWMLSNQTLRFNEILKRMPDVTQKMLTQQLRSLEKDHLIIRHVYPTVPVKVEYEISETGKQIIPIMEMMHNFGATYIEQYREELEIRKEESDNSKICSTEEQ